MTGKKDAKAVGVGTLPLGEHLRAARLARGLTMARLSGVSGASVSAIHTAEQTGRVTRQLAEKVAPALGVKPEDLTGKVE